MCTQPLFEWNTEKIFNNNRPFPSNTFRALIIGESSSGKTVLLNKLLLTPNLLDYNNLLIYTSTSDQKIYQMLYHGYNNGLTKEDIVNLYNVKEEFKGFQPEEICKQLSESKKRLNPNFFKEEKTSVQLVSTSAELPPPKKLDKNKKNLCIFDDCVTDATQGVMGSYFTKGRHSNCNVFYLSQSFFKLDRSFIRGNANVFILFRRPKRELQAFYNDMCPTMDSQDSFIQTVTNYWGRSKHNYVFINKDDGIITNDIFDPSTFEIIED